MKKRNIITTIFLALLITLIYSNTFKHEFVLDSEHVAKFNPAIKNLSNIKSFFLDSTTFSTNPLNLDFRPVLQVSFALNYWVSGVNTWSWHLFSLFLFLVILMYFLLFTEKILELSYRKKEEIYFYLPLLSVVLYAVNPINSGVINYESARSSLLTAAFLMPGFYYFLMRSSQIIPLFLFALAMFTKIEAVSGVFVFFMLEVVFKQRSFELLSKEIDDNKKNPNHDFKLKNIFNGLKILPSYLAVLVLYYIMRKNALPKDTIAGWANMDSYSYFCTQITVWWYYLLKWFWPVGLIGDDLSYEKYYSLLETPVLLSILGFLVLGFLFLKIFKKHPWVFCYGLFYFALVSPTSSFVPLSEMVNEHRPFFPVLFFSTIWVVLPGVYFFEIYKISEKFNSKNFRLPTVFFLTFFILILSKETYSRNKVFQSNENYWKDVVKKAPSSRSYNNYGLIFLGRGDYNKSLEYFLKAHDLAPNWHIVDTNLAITYGQLGDQKKALEYFDSAIKNDPTKISAYFYAGRYFFKIGMMEKAKESLRIGMLNAINKDEFQTLLNKIP